MECEMECPVHTAHGYIGVVLPIVYVIEQASLPDNRHRPDVLALDPHSAQQLPGAGPPNELSRSSQQGESVGGRLSPDDPRSHSRFGNPETLKKSRTLLLQLLGFSHHDGQRNGLLL
jgi:hypothetical protein